MSEFEKQLFTILDAYKGLEIDVEAAVKLHASTLLELAKKELTPKWRKTSGGYCGTQYRVYLTEQGAYLFDQIEQKEISINELEKLPVEESLIY